MPFRASAFLGLPRLCWPQGAPDAAECERATEQGWRLQNLFEGLVSNEGSTGNMINHMCSS